MVFQKKVRLNETFFSFKPNAIKIKVRKKPLDFGKLGLPPVVVLFKVRFCIYLSIWFIGKYDVHPGTSVAGKTLIGTF